MKPLALDLPYPKITPSQTDVRSVNIIAPAYFGQFGENTAVLQYIYHELYFKRYQMEDVAVLLEEISIAEMTHAEMLATAILNLGCDPIYVNNPAQKSPYYNTATVSRSNTPKIMLLDDIAGETHAIKDYRSMLDVLDNDEVKALIARIILDEELHLEKLKYAYQQLCES